MNSERYCEIINSGLARLVAEVRQSDASNLLSINVHAEGFFRAFLNLLNGWALQNANAADPNAKGVDLLYPGGNVVAQVSSTTDHEKIQSSLKKSARYAGAQFYFIAIDDHLPDYRKPFDPHDLVFDPRTDILDTTKLYNRVVQCESVDIQRELAELVEKYFAQAGQRKTLGLRPLGSGTPRSRFEYNANVVQMQGRAAEMAELRRFLGSPGLFAWWSVTGPGGAGKTRLAYELQRELLQEGEWDVRVIPAAVLEDYPARKPDLSAACPGKTLLIVDYVQKYTEALAQLLQRLSDPDLERAAPLRLLLLERDIRNEENQIAWLAQIWGTDHHVHSAAYAQGAPRELRPLESEDGTDPLEALIRDFADKQYQDPEEECSHPLPAGKEKELKQRLAEIDPGLLRPLFAMLLADAWVRDPETERRSREELLGYIVDREWSITAERLKAFRTRLLPAACRLIWMTATAIGAGAEPLPCGRLPELLPRQWEALSRAAAAHAAELESWTLSPPEALLNRAGLMAGGQLEPLRPDLLGEYFVLDGLKRAGPAERSAFYTAVLQEPVAVLIFFGRLLNDYEILLRDPARQEVLFPADPGLDAESTARYARLLRRLFEDSRRKETRAWLAARLEALAVRQTAETEETARICSDAASMLEDMGDYPKALEYYEKTLKIVETVLGPEHPDTASTYNNLALVYRAMGDYPKALEYYEKALKIKEAVLGPEHPSTATTYNNLAGVYQAMGDYPKVLEYYEKSLEIKESVLGDEDPSTAATYNNLANVYWAMGDYPKALEYHEKARKIRESVLGPEHSDTAMTYNNLAVVYDDMGNYPKALEYHEKALKIYESVLGPEHPSTAAIYNNLASVYDDMGDYPKALEYYEKALKIRETVLGQEHPSTATTYNNLAGVYQAMGDYPKALEYYEKDRAISKKVLGPEHPSTATTYNNLAGVYLAMGDNPKALEYHEKARNIRESVLGPEHPDTATTYNNLALVYKAMGDYPKALEYHEKALKIKETVLGPEHPSTATTYNNLALVYKAMGDYPKALEYYEKDRAISEKVLGPEHPSTATTYNNLAGVYHAMGDYPKALEYFEKTVKIFETVHGPEHPSTATTYNNLANVYLEVHDLDNAIRYSDRALAVFQRVLGEAHPYTVDTKSFNGFLHMLSALHAAIGDRVWDIVEQMKSNRQ